MSPTPHQDDLHWLAFQYVCGDLSPDSTVDFEECLLEDQQAREAVADAVELVRSMALADVDVTPSRGGPYGGRWGKIQCAR